MLDYVLISGLLALAPAALQDDQATSKPSPYVSEFLAAVRELDARANATAAAAFIRAGRLAHAAPVWRVHAAVSLTRCGRANEATALAAEALRLGYPTSDLVAIDPELARRALKAVGDGDRAVLANSVEITFPAFDRARSGPTLESLHVERGEDVVHLQLGERWLRWSLSTLALLPANASSRIRIGSADPAAYLTRPDAKTRQRILFLLDYPKDLAQDPIVLDPSGKRWLIGRDIDPLVACIRSSCKLFGPIRPLAALQ